MYRLLPSFVSLTLFLCIEVLFLTRLLTRLTFFIVFINHLTQILGTLESRLGQHYSVCIPIFFKNLSSVRRSFIYRVDKESLDKPITRCMDVLTAEV